MLQKGRWYSVYRGSDGGFAEHASGDVARAHRSYDGDESKIQTLIKYETGKVANDEDFYGVDKQGNTIYEPSEINSRIDKSRLPLGSFLGNLPQVMQDAGLSANSAGGASIGLRKRFENQLLLLRRDTDTGIPDREVQAQLIGGLGLQSYL